MVVLQAEDTAVVDSEVVLVGNLEEVEDLGAAASEEVPVGNLAEVEDLGVAASEEAPVRNLEEVADLGAVVSEEVQAGSLAEEEEEDLEVAVGQAEEVQVDGGKKIPKSKSDKILFYFFTKNVICKY